MVAREIKEDAVVASYVIALADERKRLPIAQLGVRYKGKQRIEITRSMLSDVVKNFRKLDTGELPIDYEHGIEGAEPGQAIPAAGWIKAIDDAPDENGILWGTVEWTRKAAAHIAAKEYKYISPVIDPTVRDNKTGDAQGWTLTSAALTNTPVLKGMPALVLSEAGWDLRGDAEERPKGRKEQNVKKVILADRVARTVKLIADDGTESLMVVEGLEAQPAQPKVLRLSDVKRDAKSKEYDFASLDVSGDGVLVAGEVFRAQQAQMVLSDAVKAGKILPAQRAAYEKMALSDLVELVATMKPQIDLSTRGTPEDKGGGADETAVRINVLVKEKIAASEGKRMDYATAFKAVLSEHTDLAESYKAGLRGGK